jgi:hypothetical protein
MVLVGFLANGGESSTRTAIRTSRRISSRTGSPTSSRSATIHEAIARRGGQSARSSAVSCVANGSPSDEVCC